jgi:hypothetical protein
MMLNQVGLCFCFLEIVSELILEEAHKRTDNTAFLFFFLGGGGGGGVKHPKQ